MRGGFEGIRKIVPILAIILLLIVPVFAESGDPLSPVNGGEDTDGSGLPGGTPDSCTTTGLCLDFTSAEGGFFGVIETFWAEGIAPLFGQITQSAREWDNLPAKPPEDFGPRVVESYGLSEGALENACGSSYDQPLINVSKELSYVFLGIGILLLVLGRFAIKSSAMKFFAGLFFVIFTLSTNAAAWVLFGWVIFLIILFEMLAAPPENLQKEFMEPDNWKAAIAKDIVQSLFGEAEYTEILNVAATADDDFSKLSNFQKISHMSGEFLDKSTSIPGVDNRVIGATSGGYSVNSAMESKDPSYRRAAKKSALAGREAIKATVYDVFRAFSVVELGYVWIAMFFLVFLVTSNTLGISSVYGYLPVGEPAVCVNIWASIIPATFWAFWVWQIVSFVVEKSVFLLAAFLPRPVVIWILLPFNGGPIPLLSDLIELAFKFLGTLYIVSLAKPLAGATSVAGVTTPAGTATIFSSGMDLFIASVVAALFYMLLIVTSIGMRVLFLYLTLPFTAIPKFIWGIIKGSGPYQNLEKKVAATKDNFKDKAEKLGDKVDATTASWKAGMKKVNPWEGSMMTGKQKDSWGKMKKAAETDVDPNKARGSIGGFFRSLGSKLGGQK